MLSVSRLLNGTVTEGDVLRYGRSSQQGPAHLLHFSADKKPVVAWNITGQCNLKCMHCYASATSRPFDGELTTAECYKVLDDLAAYKVPSVLFSGGEPLMRPELFEFAAYARKIGLRTVLSTNGTLIDREMAQRIHDTGFTYAGISLDGMEPTYAGRGGRISAFDITAQQTRDVVDYIFTRCEDF
jgi:MoaA/NifB/PqqE/SkfB family radical SAM enzyme